MKMKRIGIIALLIMIGSKTSIGQPSDQGRYELVQRYLEIEEERLGFTGVCLIAKRGEIQYHQAFGEASIELNAEMEVDHRFRIASISKSFTALLIGKAVDEGKLNLQDYISTYLPDFEGENWGQITIQQLLTHTSGIPHHKGMENYWTIQSRLTLSSPSILEAIRKMELQFKPGTNFLYSSPAYFLLATILEKIYDMPLSQLWMEKIGQPLELTNTGLYNNRTLIPRLTSGYHLMPDKRVISAPYRDFSSLKGGGDMYSSASDLNRWNQYILEKLQEPGFIADAVQPKNAFLAPRHEASQYGYGWFIRAAQEAKPLVYFHGGGTFGCSAINAVYPKEELSIILLSNVSGLPIDLIWQNVERIAFGWPFDLPKILPATRLPTTSLKQYVGDYVSTSPAQRLRVFIHDEQLYAQLQGRPPFSLTPMQAHKFYGNKVDISFTFQLEGGNQVVGLKAEGRGRNFSFEKAD